MIKLTVIGNLGKDALLNQVNGKNVINFSVAHTERYKDSTGAQKEKTTWVECAYWTDRTGVVPYLKRGAQVYAEGTPELRHYTKNDGTAGTSLSLRVSYVQLVGNKAEGGSPTQPAQMNQGYSQPVAAPAYNDVSAPADMAEPMDDLPF